MIRRGRILWTATSNCLRVLICMKNAFSLIISCGLCIGNCFLLSELTSSGFQTTDSNDKRTASGVNRRPCDHYAAEVISLGVVLYISGAYPTGGYRETHRWKMRTVCDSNYIHSRLPLFLAFIALNSNKQIWSSGTPANLDSRQRRQAVAAAAVD